jgi:hypothetical protein
VRAFLLLLLLMMAASAAGQPSRPDGTATTGSATPFSLLPAANCDNALDVRHCMVAAPKDWIAEERQTIQAILHRLSGNELVQGILVGVRENGYSGLQRYASDTRHDAASGRVPKLSPGFVLYPARVIALTDLFFQTDDMKDSISGYLLGDVILMHELIHAFDDRTLSGEAGFTSVTGWQRRDGQWAYSYRVDYSGYHGVVAETMTLYARGRYRDAYARDRAFATSMRVPLPTIQSLATPEETFADVLAHLIVDPNATSYLKQEVVAWFEAHVFPTLRENARRYKAEDYLGQRPTGSGQRPSAISRSAISRLPSAISQQPAATNGQQPSALKPSAKFKNPSNLASSKPWF